MIELGVSSGPDAPRVERRNYTGMLTTAAEVEAASGLLGAAVGAVEIAASWFARAFASADVEPAGVRTAGLFPSVLGDLARRLVTRGECVHLIDVAGGAVVLTPATSWTVQGAARRPWRYQVTLTGPSTTSTVTVPEERIAHTAWAWDERSPWRGRSPLALAGESGRLAKALERALADESAGPVGHLIAMPADAGDEGDDGGDDPLAPLKREIAGLRGRVGLVETTAAGWGEGRAAAPSGDWRPQRLGASPPDSLPVLREAVESTVLACCGLPPDLVRAGGAQREAYRRWVAASVAPLARTVADELGRALDVPDLRLRFDALGSADVAGRARAFQSLTGGGMDAAEAKRIAGLD
ncbi:MAG: hypothetical protein OXH69_19385 [Acidobacteria bacterium]|nr:hypothetical protein [Acidobacteriota bacterium]